jgi:hypothetical protein
MLDGSPFISLLYEVKVTIDVQVKWYSIYNWVNLEMNTQSIKYCGNNILFLEKEI